MKDDTNWLISCPNTSIKPSPFEIGFIRPLKADMKLLNKLKTIQSFDFVVLNFEDILKDQGSKFMNGYIRKNDQDISALLQQPETGKVPIKCFASDEVINMYKKSNS